MNPDRFNSTKSCWSTFYSSGLEMPQSFSLQLGGMDWPFHTLTSLCFIYRQSQITPWTDLSKHNHSFRLECKLLALKKTERLRLLFSRSDIWKVVFACHDRVWWIVFHFNLRPAVLLELSCIFNKLLRIPEVIQRVSMKAASTLTSVRPCSMLIDANYIEIGPIQSNWDGRKIQINGTN